MANKQIPAADIGATNYSFRANTSDGSDNAYLGIVGGGNESVNRGGAVYVYGNEYSGTPGSIQIQAGNVANSRIEFKNSGAVVGLVHSAGLEMNYPITLSGSISSAGASTRNIHGNGNANDWVINCPAGGKFVFSTNGTTQTLISSAQGIETNYVQSSGYVSASSFYSSGNSPVICGGSSYPYDGAKIYLYTIGHPTYPGANQSFANLSTRAASTAFAVCPVATGDVAVVTLLNNAAGAQRKASIEIDSAATVTITGDAAYVNSSSPGASEIGIYISAGVLYCKPGSSFTGKLATFSQIGKA